MKDNNGSSIRNLGHISPIFVNENQKDNGTLDFIYDEVYGLMEDHAAATMTAEQKYRSDKDRPKEEDEAIAAELTAIEEHWGQVIRESVAAQIAAAGNEIREMLLKHMKS